MKAGLKVAVIAPLVAFLLMFNACTVDKRVYNSGYHIDWFSKKGKASESTNKTAHNASKPSQLNPVNEAEKPQGLIAITEQTTSAISSAQPPITYHPETEVSTIQKNIKNNRTRKAFEKRQRLNDLNPLGFALLQNPSTKYVESEKQSYVEDGERIFSKGDSEYESLAIWSFILSIIALFFAPLFIVSLILSIIALNKISKSNKKGRSLAIAALVISLLAVLLFFAIVLWLIAVF